MSPNPGRTEYYLPKEMSNATWLLAGVAALFAVLWLLLVPAQGTRIGLGLFFLLLAGVLAVQARATPGIRLELSAEGLCYRHFGYKLCTPWPNVAGRLQKRTGRGVVEGLALRQPAEVTAWRPWVAAIIRLLNFWGERSRFIPLTPFLISNPDLLQDLERFLPGLVSPTQAETTKT
jgi:hypothetical protein